MIEVFDQTRIFYCIDTSGRQPASRQNGAIGACIELHTYQLALTIKRRTEYSIKPTQVLFAIVQYWNLGHHLHPIPAQEILVVDVWLQTLVRELARQTR
jgi:hypothetical protein